jgi:hypothetical protein
MSSGLSRVTLLSMRYAMPYDVVNSIDELLIGDYQLRFHVEFLYSLFMFSIRLRLFKAASVSSAQ